MDPAPDIWGQLVYKASHKGDVGDWGSINITQCTPKVSLLVGLKQVQTKLLSFHVTLIHKNPKELNPKIGGLLRYRLHRVVKSL